MKHKTIWRAAALVTFLIGLAAFRLAELSSPLPSDSALSKTLLEHQETFNQLVKMMNEDSTVLSVGKSSVCLKNDNDWPQYIYLYEDKPWPYTKSELKFSKRRWDEYQNLFRELNLKMGVERKEHIPGAIFFLASFDSSEIDQAEPVVIEKGYVYSSNSLDDLQIKYPLISFKRLNRNWYLYYEWFVSKPE